ncbi:SigE family RNA polymerase sigma factor [Calidifontibacter indicus]|uniref:RNA polymerase sigma-70 factor (Sigma-E family) n=1 Tax=Calidifontibacter indicus TaxID=419650 RepID=A0A3D9UR09_9MICO|nr:SigE family RNA polymerase sigma factor [Calidifontibacter indicus]REF31696.1 RNA polymerase sigma-70 factor (sigma-E family) [Calidifontibacter indicus]
MIASTRGEPDGFTEFVRARGGSLHRTAMLLTHDHAAAEDLVQTALAKAWQNWHRADQPEAYVRRILVNEFASGWRRKWRGEVPTDELPERPLDDGDRLDTRAGLIDALARLPRQQRAVVVLRYYQDYTEEQTARTLGISVGTVKSHTSRALSALRISPHLAATSEGGRR